MESGDYFIGDTVQQAGFKGREKYPSKQFFFFRIGFKAVYSHKGLSLINRRANVLIWIHQ